MSHYWFKAKCSECSAVTDWMAIDLGREWVISPSFDGYRYECGTCGQFTYREPQHVESSTPDVEPVEERE